MRSTVLSRFAPPLTPYLHDPPPLRGQSILTVLKGAGIAEMEEKLEKIRLKEAEGKGDLTSSTGKVVQAVPMKDGKDTTQEV